MLTSVNKMGGVNMAQLDVVGGLIKNLERREENLVLVVSAFEGVTDALFKALDDLNATDYQESNIDQSFEPVKAIHDQMIDRFFKGEFAGRAQKAYTQEYEKLRLALMAHKQVSQVLTPVEGTFEIRDQVIGFGEKIGGAFLKIYLEQEGHETHFFEEVNCKQDGLDGKGVISQRRLHEAMRAGIRESLATFRAQATSTRGKLIRIFGGHVAGTPRGIAIDVGRNYSDTTMVDVALALREEGQESIGDVIAWKDVDGVKTADPKDLDPAKNNPIVHPEVSLQEGLEMAAAGSSLIHGDALDLAYENKLDLRVKNIQHPDRPGTVYTHGSIKTSRAFKSIIGYPHVDTITIECPQMANKFGFGEAMTAILAKHQLSFDSSPSEGTSMTFSVHLPKDPADQEAARGRIRAATKELENLTVGEESYEATVDRRQDAASISVVGNELADRVGILSEITGILGAFGINIRGISHGERQRRITVIIDRDKLKFAIQKLHSLFVDNNQAVYDDFVQRSEENRRRVFSTFNQ